MELTHPGRLAALVALAIPIILHLWHRRPGRVVRIGSIRHLGPGAVSRQLSARLNEKWLLLLRLMVLAALVLSIAGPAATWTSPGTAVAIVDPALSPESAERVMDSLARAGDRVIRPPVGDLWSLARETDATLPPGSRLTLVTTPAARLLGPRAAVSALPILLLAADPASGREARARETQRHHFDIITEAPDHPGVRYLSAAIAAVAATRGDSVVIDVTPVAGRNGGNGATRHLYWLRSGEIDPRTAALVRLGVTVIEFREGPIDRRLESPLAIALPGSRVAAVRAEGLGTIARIPVADALARFGPTGELLALVSELWPEPPGAPTDAEVRHSEQQILPRHLTDGSAEGHGTPIGQAVLALAAALFLLERVASHRPRAGR